ncbi:MAG: hypothetical protein ABWY63_01705 [Hyphomicrobiaceae bacterium]
MTREEIDALYRQQPPAPAPLQQKANPALMAAAAPPAAAAAAPQVGVYPQPSGRNFYTMESDWFRGLSPDQQRQMVGAAVTPEGMGPNAYAQPMGSIPLPQQAIVPGAGQDANPNPILSAEALNGLSQLYRQRGAP